MLNWIHNDSNEFRYLNKKRILDFLGNIYEGSNRPGQPRNIKDIDKINESVGLSSPKYAEVREMLLKNSDMGERDSENPISDVSFRI